MGAHGFDNFRVRTLPLEQAREAMGRHGYGNFEVDTLPLDQAGEVMGGQEGHGSP